MMRRTPILLVSSVLTALAASGCTGPYKADFQVIVTNRVVNAIQVIANGSELGQVSPGQQATFSVRLTETNSNTFTNGVAPTPQGQVTLTAKDLKTGALSSAKSMALTQSTPAYVTFASTDFPASVATVARFTFSPNSPAPNQDVQFNASGSTPSNGTFNWNFGDGTTGTGVTPVKRYGQAGTFTVTLTVTNDTGQSAVSTSTLTVSTSLPSQTVNFTFSPSAPAVNQDVFFNASTSTISGATYAWDFGDGGTATGVTTTHKFARAGTYTVTLRATNNVGQAASTSRTVSVSNTSPQVVASFTFSPTTPGINQEIFFNASASTPSNGTFTWSFGDGTEGSGVTPTHEYSQPGTYNVTLTVANDVGQQATTSRTVTVAATSSQVVASFVFSPTAPGIDQEVFFDASASRPSNGTFSWNFGDGTTGTGATPSHRYSQASTYTVTLVVTNEFGQSAATSRTITVSATSPQVVASFTFSPTAPGVGQDVFFNASASRPTDATYTWNFGDGTTGTGVTPTHRYAQAATYTVTLLVTNSFGQSATTSRTVTVSATSSQVVASFTFSPTSPAVSQDVFFNASASRPADATYTWNFGDGTAGTGVTPTHRYAQAATYTVTLIVTNDLGQSATTSRTVTVSPTSTQVAASFTFSPTNPGVNQDVFFNASASRPPDGTFTWNFGDGSTGSGVTPTHRYARGATYTVTLVVANATGQSATTTRAVTVSATSTVIVADFTFSPADPAIAAGTNTVIFDATPSSGTLTSWTWDFGDGSAAATGQRVSHTFSRQGTWVVRLTVSDAEGRTATTTKNVTVAP